jgi:hypothetical protein
MRRFAAVRVSDGTRTRDRLDHNQELYLLSYAHHVPPLRATGTEVTSAEAGRRLARIIPA